MPYDHTVTCNPAEIASLALTPAFATAGTRFIHQLKDERLNRPEPTQVNDLPRVATEVLATFV